MGFGLRVYGSLEFDMMLSGGSFTSCQPSREPIRSAGSLQRRRSILGGLAGLAALGGVGPRVYA